MKINFLMNDVAYVDYKTTEVIWGWEPTDKRLGGTEESVVRWIEELDKRGHETWLFYNRRGNHTYGITQVFGTNQYRAPREIYDANGADICINIKSSEIDPKEPTLYLTNETDANLKDLSKYLGVIWPSEWATDNIHVNNPRKFILPHGYDEKKINTSQKKINKQCLYASSPDRGLETLEQLWPLIVDQHPDAHLYVTYGGKINTPNTTCGEFSEEEMNNLYNTSDIWLHPCQGGELFGISGIKAQAAGAIPVYFPTMALAETVKGGIACTDTIDMYDKLNALLGDETEKTRLRTELSKIHFDNWADSTDKLLEIIESVILK